MGDCSPPMKPDEQYPLLKVEGGGDMSHAAPTHAVVAPDWGVTCKKNSRFSRWPEFISAVWMTLILCGISFIIFHVLGLGINQRQQFIILKSNDSNDPKAATNVYYHQIVSRGSQIPFILYTEYLSSMAVKYPLLQFNVIFLVDDVVPDMVRGLKRNPAFYHSWLYNTKLDDIGKDAFSEFRRRYHNVNVTIIPLSKFMAKTPLKYKWRMISQEYLVFYARVYSVWQNGGIGMDLRTFNNDYHNRLFTDRRIDSILSLHNDGINTAAYIEALNKIDQDEINAVFSMFSSIVNHFLNHTRSFFNRTLPFSYENPLIARNKREAINQTETGVTETSNDPKDFYNIDNALTLVQTNYTNNTNESTEGSTTNSTDPVAQSTNTTDLKMSKMNGSEIHQIVFYYDFSIMSPNYGKPEPYTPLFKSKSPTASKSMPYLLSMDIGGIFIAASSKYHPFLGNLISSGCFGMHPKFAIQDALVTQCSGVYKNQYCNNIYVL